MTTARGNCSHPAVPRAGAPSSSRYEQRLRSHCRRPPRLPVGHPDGRPGTLARVTRDPAVVISIANAALIRSFASNIFGPPGTMPGWLQAFADVNPLSHIATAARDLMNDTGGAVVWSLTAIAVITLVCAPITLRRYSQQR